MALAAGARLGPYEITAPLGSGGMGEVYKASDTRLDRTVAIKVLPTHVAADPHLRERFEREARAVAALNHPHICTLHDVGQHDGIDYLVMEYLDGQTLAQRLEKGAPPLDQALHYAVQIADALDKAHRQGIVHRDLKPGNIMLTKSGVKLLDFGLAKLAPAAHVGIAGMTGAATQTSPLTGHGTILGTLQYMAPEQLEGKEADARTDIFAFGVVVYEMVTGKKAFEGKSQASLISSIMSVEPAPVSSIQPMSPAGLDRIVNICLAKDPEDRWQSAHDLARELRWIQEAGAGAGGGRSNQEMDSALAANRLGGRGSFPADQPRPDVRLLPWFRSEPRPPRSSADGRPREHRVCRFRGRVAGWELAGFHGHGPGWELLPLGPFPRFPRRTLSARNGRSASAVLVPGLPSPGLFRRRQAQDHRALGRHAADPCRGVARSTRRHVGTGWNDCLRPGVPGSLLRIAATGGKVSPAIALDSIRKEQSHRWPSFLPDGRHFLYYTSRGGGEEPGEIFVGSLDQQPPMRVVESSSLAMFAAPGYLLFVRGTTLLAQPFDVDRLQLNGRPIAIADQLSSSGTRRRLPNVLGLVLGSARLPCGFGRQTQLAWLDRAGKELGVLGPPAEHYAPRLSPDGTRLAVSRFDPDQHEWRHLADGPCPEHRVAIHVRSGG